MRFCESISSRAYLSAETPTIYYRRDFFYGINQTYPIIVGDKHKVAYCFFLLHTLIVKNRLFNDWQAS